MLIVLCLIFVLSGAAGLAYESIWTRYLGLFVGHSAYAQVLVLVIFLGGMSIGAYLIGRRSERIHNPLKWYAFVEFGVGLIGLVFHDVYVATTAFAYDTIFPSLGGGVAHSLVKWLLAAVLILPQSILLGMTFPLMTAGVVRLRRERVGKTIALLYFANSIGAAAGVLIAGFVLVRLAGLPGTLLAAAITNLVVALIVLGISRNDMAVAVQNQEVSTHVDAKVLNVKLLLAVSFGTAISSFIYEIAWIRMLSLVLGSATHSFELMLSAFILGLACGAFAIQRRADSEVSSRRTLGYIQLAMGALAVATLPLYVRSFDWMADFMSAFTRTDAGYVAFSTARYVICIIVMVPATFCAGMTLPLITRELMRGENAERAIGLVYSVNTVGSIVGAALAALVLLPLLGLKWLLVLGGAIDVALGIAILWPMRSERALETGRLIPALAVVVLLFAIGSVTVVDRGVLTSGVFRYGRVHHTGDEGLKFYKDGRTATVSVRQIQSSKGLTLATNGKPDASLGPEWFKPPTVRGTFTHDASTQILLPLMTLAHAPMAKSAAAIGQGSGMSSHTLLQNEALEHLVTIEIEPEMIAASRLFSPANASVFTDKRAEFAIDDARSYFAAERNKYDIILSEPSTPWVAGVSGLFTSEFYHHAKKFLTPAGVFGQWLHLTEINDGLVLSVVRAIAENFPSYSIYAVGNRDIIIVAGLQQTMPDPDWSIVDRPGIAAELRRVYRLSPALLDNLHIINSIALSPLVRGGGGNSDFYPTLDLGAERARYLDHEAVGFVGLAGDRFPLGPILENRRVGISGEWTSAVNAVPRLEAMQLTSRMRDDQWTGASQAVTAAAERAHAVDLMLASRDAPKDWHTWVGAVEDADQSRNGGTAGYVDSAFISRVNAYAVLHNAPAEARAAVAFIHGMSGWDFAEASRAATVLIDRAKKGDAWVPMDELREGAAVARIRLGDAVGARTAMDDLKFASARDANDVRPQLLYAWIDAFAARTNPKKN